MFNTFFTCLLAAMISVGCQKADSKYLISSVQELKALNLVPGDVVVWKDGIYNDVKFTLSAQATEAAPILLKAQTPGGVTFTGTSGITLSGSYLAAEGFVFKGMDTSVKNPILTCAKGSQNCRFSEISIDGTDTEISTVDTKWVNLYGRFNEVSHCDFINKRNMGCLFVVWLEDGIVPEHTIAYNRFTRPYTHYDDNDKARNGQEAIRIGTSDFSMQDARCKVYGNYFYQCHGEQAEIISNKSCANVYTGNVFEDSKGTLTLRHGNRCCVRGNYFRSNGISSVGGIRIIGEDHLVDSNVLIGLTGDGYKSAISMVMGESNAALNGYWTVKNPIVRSNVMVNCRCALAVNVKGRSSQDTPPQNALFQKNTIVCDQSGYVVTDIQNDMPAQNMNWEGNVIFGGTQKGTSLATVAARPTLVDYSKTISDIISKAGKTW